MRSEKEIREKDLNRLCIDLMKEDQSRIKEWLFEGKPRYSVAELEKIAKSHQYALWFRNHAQGPTAFGFANFIKDRKRVEEILK